MSWCVFDLSKKRYDTHTQYPPKFYKRAIIIIIIIIIIIHHQLIIKRMLLEHSAYILNSILSALF